VNGNWEIADGDQAEIHNTNRCMGMDASDAGWPDGIESREAGTNKAVIAARIIGAVAHPGTNQKGTTKASTKVVAIFALMNVLDGSLREIRPRPRPPLPPMAWCQVSLRSPRTCPK
jgi:hypothetical protein